MDAAGTEKVKGTEAGAAAGAESAPQTGGAATARRGIVAGATVVTGSAETGMAAAGGLQGIGIALLRAM